MFWINSLNCVSRWETQFCFPEYKQTTDDQTFRALTAAQQVFVSIMSENQRNILPGDIQLHCGIFDYLLFNQKIPQDYFIFF